MGMRSRVSFMSLSKLVLVTLTTLSLFSGTILSLLDTASANEVYLDKNCRINPTIQPDDRFLSFYRAEFRANRQTYWFSAARYQDGSVIFCISRPNYRGAKPLGIRELEYQFIDNIVQSPNRNATFIVTVAEGNGSPVPLIDYRLDLSNPNRPVLTRLRRRLGRT